MTAPLPPRSAVVRRSPIGTLLACAAALGALPGCGAERDVSLDPDGTLRLAVPPALDVRAVDPLNLVPRVLVNFGTGFRGADTVRVNDQWTARVTVPEGSDVRIAITWFETIALPDGGSENLPLASVDFTISAIVDDEVRVLDAGDYDSDGFDDDGDGVSNLAERNANTSPFDPDDPGPDSAQVSVPRIDPADAPTIDGAYDPVWDDSAQFRDRVNEPLSIDNQMIDFGATQLDGVPDYRWGAMHDGEALYLIVFAESGTGQTPFGDSAEAFDDDSIDVYVDGDDSRLSEYDGVDDRHLILPLLDANGGPNSNASADARLEPGPNSAPFDPESVAFATCVCSGDLPSDEQIYELRLPLAEFDVEVGETIGFEVQINDDKDGGGRDVKWGWAHPSRGNASSFDRTFEDPSFMGTARLLP